MIRVPIRPGLLLLATLGACTEPADQASKAPATSPAGPSAKPPAGLLTASYAGQYDWGDTTRQREAGGTLLVYPESDSTVRFYLDVSNGPPAFNLGQLYQRAVVRRGVGRCAFKADYDSLGCQLRLVFSPDNVVVETEQGHSECGFGNAVSADETYRRTRAAVPRQFVDGEGKKVSFKSTTPEQDNAASQ